MTYGVTTTTSPAASTVFQPSQNSAPESKTKTDTVVTSIQRADHSETGKSLKADRAASLFEADTMLQEICLTMEVSQDDATLVQSLIDPGSHVENDVVTNAHSRSTQSNRPIGL
ncbi:hypothetical protein [Endozoicomonas sp. 2B-B]